MSSDEVSDFGCSVIIVVLFLAVIACGIVELVILKESL